MSAVSAVAPVLSLSVCLFCREDSFDPRTSYDGHRGSRRLYCSPWCRDEARNERRRRQRAHLKRYAALMEMHALEAAGQLSLDPTPLPPIPELPDDRKQA